MSGILALEYADRGWHVFPCHVPTNDGCSCGKRECESVGKHPRTTRGLKNATRDRTLINRWWPEERPNQSNVAVATGEVSGIVVVDIDPRHGGDVTLASLEAELGPLPRDWTVRTGGAGLHIYTRLPAGTRIKSRNGWRQGIDVKANGGYVVAPCSIHETGNRYEWQSQVGSEVPILPEKWLEALTKSDAPPTSPKTPSSDARAVLLQRAQQYAASIPGAVEGGRNDAAFKLAGHLAALVTPDSERLDEEDIFGVIRSWNDRCSSPLTDQELETCVASALRNGQPRAAKVIKIAEHAKEETGEEDSSGDSPRKSQATKLVELAEGLDLFHDPDGEAHARFAVGEDENRHWRVARVCTKQFKRWLAQRFYRQEGKVPAAQAQQDALNVIEARAEFDGDKRPVYVRVAEHESRIYFDLCSDNWQVIEADKHGWRILNDSPVMFRRSKAMLALPTPVHGDVHELRRFANVTEEDWPLVLAWLVAAFRPVGPYPVLAVYGEHGSGKSGLCRRLRSLVDPNTAPLRADYREPRDLMICAKSGWVVALDNLSSIPVWLSDCFCRLSTGGGFSTRTLYENDQETIFDAQRPLVLNCIEEVVTRSDLLDRCVVVNLPRIEKDRRRSEKQLDREFEEARPRILGGLLSAVVVALRNESSVQLPGLPRMADFAIWATAAEPALGLKSGQFFDAYIANREAGNETAIEASPVGKALLDFVAEVGSWSGTSTELLRELEARMDDKSLKLKSWPSSARLLGGAVKRLAPNLRDAGIHVEILRTGKKRTRLIVLSTQLEQAGNSSSASSAASAVEDPPRNSDVGANKADAEVRAADADLEWSSSADDIENLDESGMADEADMADGEIPRRSYLPNWIEL